MNESGMRSMETAEWAAGLGTSLYVGAGDAGIRLSSDVANPVEQEPTLAGRIVTDGSVYVDNLLSKNRH